MFVHWAIGTSRRFLMEMVKRCNTVPKFHSVSYPDVSKLWAFYSFRQLFNFIFIKRCGWIKLRITIAGSNMKI
jgi:hypothetical protein